jgi:hypothetical protein
MNGFGTVFDFNDVFRHEISVINDRRKQATPRGYDGGRWHQGFGTHRGHYHE